MPPRAAKVVAYFTNAAVGLYAGDDVRVLGVPVGTIDSVEPQPNSVKVSITVQDGVNPSRCPGDHHLAEPGGRSVRAVHPGLQRWRGAGRRRRGAAETGVPVEWDDVKKQLTQLSAQLGPQDGAPGPLAFINQAADTLDGNGDSFRSALRELSQTAGRLGDSRGDLFGTIKNLQILVNALSNSNEQIVQFTDHVASVSQVLAESSAGLDQTLGALNQALVDVKGLLKDNNTALIDQVGKLAEFTQMLTDNSDNIEQVLHITPNGLANFYNIYNPAQGSLDGLLSLPNFANPVQFLCGGNFDVRPRRTTTSARTVSAHGSRAAPDRDELPAGAVPPDQQHHGVQQKSSTTPADRGQGADSGAVPAVECRTRRHPAEGPAGRDAQRPDPAAAGRPGPDFAGHAAGGTGPGAAGSGPLPAPPGARRARGCSAAR
ncbi:hypothetical protein MPHO_03860 [Mycolicibacterium phocaicum]|nr:hypothetical protein MPHO_03860 [Mycolicibacterium phocaicum]